MAWRALRSAPVGYFGTSLSNLRLQAKFLVMSPLSNWTIMPRRTNLLIALTQMFVKIIFKGERISLKGVVIFISVVK
jgi:hypothetical protein